MTITLDLLLTVAVGTKTVFVPAMTLPEPADLSSAKVSESAVRLPAILRLPLRSMVTIPAPISIRGSTSIVLNEFEPQ